MHVTGILYQAAGRPTMDGAETGVCRVCGAAGVGLVFDAWVRESFMDWDKLGPGEILCHACQFAFTDRSAPLGDRLQTGKPQRMRNYSHFVVGGVWYPVSKGDKRRMAEILLHLAPEVAVIAVSGQKHLIFRASPGWWQFEEQAVRPFPAQLATALQAVEALYGGGFAKSEIESGRYSQARIMAYGLAAWRAQEDIIKPLRGALSLALALFLAQRPQEEDGGSIRDGDAIAGAALAGGARGVQKPVSSEHLAAIRGQRPVGGVHIQPEPVRQLDLFAFGDPSGDG